jgi:hypothetical protein
MMSVVTDENTARPRKEPLKASRAYRSAYEHTANAGVPNRGCTEAS